MTQEQQKNMYEVRKLRDQVDEIIKPAFHSWQSVDSVKTMLYNTLFQDYVAVVDTKDNNKQA